MTFPTVSPPPAQRPPHQALREAAERRERWRTSALALAVALVAAGVFAVVPPVS